MQQFSCMLPMALARSSSDGVGICYVLPVLRVQCMRLYSCLMFQVNRQNTAKPVAIHILAPHPSVRGIQIISTHGTIEYIYETFVYVSSSQSRQNGNKKSPASLRCTILPKFHRSSFLVTSRLHMLRRC